MVESGESPPVLNMVSSTCVRHEIKNWVRQTCRDFPLTVSCCALSMVSITNPQPAMHALLLALNPRQPGLIVSP